MRSRIRPVNLIGLLSAFDASSSRKVKGTPIFSAMSAFPDMREPYGKVSAAMIRTARNTYPKISPNLFVGISCLGMDLPRISDSFSLPAYLYFIFFELTFLAWGTGTLCIVVEFGRCILGMGFFTGVARGGLGIGLGFTSFSMVCIGGLDL